MFDAFYERFEREEFEVIALIKDVYMPHDLLPGKAQCGISIGTMGMEFCDSGELVSKALYLDLPLSEKECKEDKVFKRFKHGQICRLKISKLKAECRAIHPLHSWCIRQVLQEHDESPKLSKLFEEYQRYIVHDQVLGTLLCNKVFMEFENFITYNNIDAHLTLYLDSFEKLSCTKAAKAAKTMISRWPSWDKKLREYAGFMFADELNLKLQSDYESQLANFEGEKRSCDENGGCARKLRPEVISEEQLANDIRVYQLVVSRTGRFTALLTCNTLIYDVSMSVEGTLKDGILTGEVDILEATLSPPSATQILL